MQNRKGVCCTCQTAHPVHPIPTDPEGLWEVGDDPCGEAGNYVMVNHDDASGSHCEGSGTTPQAVLAAKEAPMRVLVFDMETSRIEEGSPTRLISESEPLSFWRFFGTRDTIVIGQMPLFSRVGQLFGRYADCVEDHLKLEDLVIAGHCSPFSGGITIMDWMATSVGVVRTPKDLLDRVMDALGATKEGEEALAYRRHAN